MKRVRPGLAVIATAMLTSAGVADRLAGGGQEPATPSPTGPAAITVDYPASQSLFPPDMAAPTFLWRDAAAANHWAIEITFADGSAPLHARTAGPRMRVGPIDPRCVSPVNEPPKLTPEQAAAHTWKPDPATWAAIKAHSIAGPAIVTFTGFRVTAPGRTAAASARHPAVALSRGQVQIRTSKDPVGAPIFYRDVPLMPSAGEKGLIQPLATAKVPLIAWRLRDVRQPTSRLLLTGMHTCANCHSFSRDGRTFGMDLDGPKNDKGLYAITPLKPVTTIRNENVVSWSRFRSKLGNQLRVGFMSQVSPDGRYVVTTIKPRETSEASTDRPLGSRQLLPLYYVANFADYRFLQVFYPIGGILVVYDRASGELKPLPGADDPRYVQANAVWSPDGQWLVFARAEAKEPPAPGQPQATRANDPNEVQIQYDLYRVPFNGGRGGSPEPIPGASRNGMSNSFPKVSPDGRFIVFVQARNGLLMRPDSQLTIVPAYGGEARRMRCNTPLMNSWHSFSPNGRWLVFSSKSRSPYTQMFLTHVGEEGDDTPPILVEDATAANRAVNIPEFVNVARDGFQRIDVPAAEFYRQFNVASELTEKGRYAAAILAWRKALLLNAEDDRAQNSYAVALASTGRVDEAIPHFEKALALNPGYDEAQNSFGAALMGAGRVGQAIPHYEKALEINPDNAEAQSNLGVALAQKGRLDEAVPHLEQAVALDPGYVQARANLGSALMQQGRYTQAVLQLEKGLEAAPDSAELHNSLGLAYLWQQRGDDAVRHLRKAVAIAPKLVQARENLGNALYFLQGRPREAVVEWREVLRLQPSHAPVLAQTAWVLATSPDAALRNGAEAVVLAERAAQLSTGEDPAALDALAAAYAEVGRFPTAAETARQALAIARQQGNQPLVEALAGRLESYGRRVPFRDQR